MKTSVTDSYEDAARYIRRGDLAAFPTETVYGLGADAYNPEAVRRIYIVKGRPLDNPMIVHLADRAQIATVAAGIPSYAQQLVDAFFPGPLTVVLEKAARIPAEVTAGLNTVGVRIPDHPVALEFLRACGGPVAAPSANRSGRPSPTSWESVKEDLDGLIPCILRGDRTTVGLESTVVDCTGSVPVILREGAVSLQELRRVVPSLQPASAALGRESRSPGLRYRHYAPRARVTIFRSDEAVDDSAAFIGVAEPADVSRFEQVMICRSPDHYAHELFHFFRECDRAGIRTIYCERPPPSGIGAALLDRILRAGQGRKNE